VSEAVGDVLYYSIVQVVPDMARGERMNVGVIAWDAARQEGAVRFTRQRQRLRALGIADTAFLSQFQAWVAEAVAMKGSRLFSLPGHPGDPWSLELMRYAAQEWGGMIQLSEPHPSHGDNAERVAVEVYERAVHLPPPAEEPEAGRQAIRRSVARTLRGVLRQRYGQTAPVTVHVTHEVGGEVDSHLFDVVLANHDARSILVTPNLGDPRTTEVRRDLEAAAWSIQDVHTRDPEITFGLVREPSARSALLTRVDALARHLPVTPVERDDLPAWAVREAERAEQHARA
jgi:hypothetical protein